MARFPFTRTNQLMEDCLQELEAYLAQPKQRCRTELLYLCQVLRSPIVVHQGCYLLRIALRRDMELDPDGEYEPDEPFNDRTYYEWFENHVHTIDILNNHKVGLHHLAAGVTIAEMLALKLAVQFPTVPFNVFVSFPVKPIPLPDMEPEDEVVRNDCVIRFWAVRDGEDMIDDELENYAFDACGYIHVNDGQSHHQ